MTDNPYWDQVQPYLATDHFGATIVDQYDMYGPRRQNNIMERVRLRHDFVDQYAWTVTDPATVAFVRDHAGTNIIDPLAGSGYWAHLLRHAGAAVAAYDAFPPSAGGNRYHKSGVEHVRIKQGDAAAVVAGYPTRTLLLAWPPYDASVGADILAAYAGQRVVYIGEGEGGCCGDDDLFATLRRGWREIAEHRPVQWDGIRDWVTVYERRAES